MDHQANAQLIGQFQSYAGYDLKAAEEQCHLQIRIGPENISETVLEDVDLALLHLFRLWARLLHPQRNPQVLRQARKEIKQVRDPVK